MPILNIQFGETNAQGPDGQTILIPPHLGLVQRGPIIQVSLNLARAIAEQLLARGQQLPEPRSGLALIDTGASATCIAPGPPAHRSAPSCGGWLSGVRLGRGPGHRTAADAVGDWPRGERGLWAPDLHAGAPNQDRSGRRTASQRCRLSGPAASGGRRIRRVQAPHHRGGWPGCGR